MDETSGVKGDFHAPFCGSPGVRFPRATRRGETAILVSRYLSGGTLLDRIADSQESGTGLPVGDILRIAVEIASGLEHIHGRRILYRDLQPRNVLFDERGTVHLVDFDTAVSLDDAEMSDLSQRPVIDHMAPKLADGASTDERADLYSLGHDL
jgi:serine/threonine protein kinase